jgi:DNA-binding response OmpR family regulator
LDCVRVLFVDDDLDIQKLVGSILNNEGMQVIFADDGLQAIDTWRQNEVDLVVLDVMMPVLDGFETCRRLRRVSDVPILMLTAKGLERDVVQGFEMGADDYVTKPFRAREFVARIKALVNRYNRQEEQEREKLAYQHLVLDLKARRVTYWGKTIQVTPLEFQLLQYLMKNMGTVLSKEELLRNVWGHVETVGDMNLIEAAIRRLRKKLELDPSSPEYIQTVWGTGYRFGD